MRNRNQSPIRRRPSHWRKSALKPKPSATSKSRNDAPLDLLAGLASSFHGEASRVVLNGFELRTEAKLVRYPDHYPRGADVAGDSISSMKIEPAILAEFDLANLTLPGLVP